MEKKLTNSDPLMEPADKHSIYAIKQEQVYLSGVRTKRLGETGRFLDLRCLLR
jgi:hypothetical protein